MRFYAYLAGMFVLVLSIVGCATDTGGETGVDAGTSEAGAGEDAIEYPTENINLVAAGSPGGGLDTQARLVDRTLREAGLQDVPFQIENMGGGGGNPARAYLLEQEEDPYTLLIESNRVFLNELIGNTHLGLDHVQPLARLTTEYNAWVVREDSPYTDATEVLEDLKEDPKSVVFGVGTVPSNDQMNILRPAKAYGIENISEIEITAFDSGGDLLTNLLGGHIPIISTNGLGPVMEQVEEGNVRVLAYSAPEPLGGEFEGIPTWQELGLDVSILHWRGLFAPPGVPQEAIDYWDEKLGELVQTEEWKEAIADLQLHDGYADSETFTADLKEEREAIKPVLEEVGMLGSEAQ